jgi:hypothetical protein
MTTVRTIVTGLGVEAPNRVPGTSTQIEVRGRDGSMSRFWMGRALITAGGLRGTSPNPR